MIFVIEVLFWKGKREQAIIHCYVRSEFRGKRSYEKMACLKVMTLFYKFLILWILHWIMFCNTSGASYTPKMFYQKQKTVTGNECTCTYRGLLIFLCIKIRNYFFFLGVCTRECESATTTVSQSWTHIPHRGEFRFKYTKGIYVSTLNYSLKFVHYG